MYRVTCNIFQDAILDLSRDVPLPAATEAVVKSHIEVCRACAERLQRQRELSDGLRAIGRLALATKPSPDLAPRLFEAFVKLHEQPAPQWPVSSVWAAAAAAVLVIAAAGVWTAATLSRIERSPAASAAAGPTNAWPDGFVMLPVAAGLPAFESGLIVRVDVPVSALPSYGVEVIPDTSKSQIEADLLVGQDGQPRAIRFVTGGGTSAASSEPRSRP